MTDNVGVTDRVENLILEMLKGLRNELKTFRTRYDADVTDLKHRLTSIERGMRGVKRAVAEVQDDEVGQQAAIDRVSERLDVVERRLDITSAL